ncbi:MAG: LPXTG cell wall anchor domain-containing protein, partial [Coprobacillus sp.]|nr:LPXTG cell wall anchor domain-containing protein [Coprobacillus sp.]
DKVKTGDQTSITTYIMTLFIGLAGMMVLVYKRKKENL